MKLVAYADKLAPVATDLGVKSLKFYLALRKVNSYINGNKLKLVLDYAIIFHKRIISSMVK